MKTYWSLDICSLPHRLKEELCHNILNQSPFEYYSSFYGEEQSNESSNSIGMDLKDSYQMYTPDKNINHRCSKRTVNLVIREIDNLKAKYFSMWQCPKVEATSVYTTTYHIAKYHLKNALLVFKTCDAWENEDIIFTEAVATKIDRESLAQIVLHDVTAH